MNPGWTDADRDEYFSDLGWAVTLWRMAEAGAQFLHPQANQYRAVFYHDTARTAFGRTLKITEGKRSLDTDADCLVYARVVDNPGGAGTQRIDFYRGSARDNTASNELVASTGNVADNTAGVAVTPQAGYTMAGTIDVTTVAAGFDFTFHLEVPPAKRMLHQFSGTRAYDSQLRDAGLAALATMRTNYEGARAAAAAFAAEVLATEIMPTIPARTGDELLSEGITVDSGVYSANPKGQLPDLKLAMTDNTGGSGEVRAGKGTFVGTPSFPQWQGQASAPTIGHRALPADVTFRCVKKLGSTLPEFQATRSTDDSRRRPNEGRGLDTISRVLRIGALWVAPEWGIDGFTVNLKASISSVTNALLSTTFSDWSVSWLTSSNSSAGVFYPHYNGSTLNFYKTQAGRTALDADDVAASVALAPAAVNTVFQAVGASGLTINGKTGAGSGGVLVNGSTATVDFQVPSITGGSYFALDVAETVAPSDWVDNMRKGAVGSTPFAPNTTEGVEAANLSDSDTRAGVPGCNVGVAGSVI